jgi:two-component system copper resistance phosphate regulon response regulator CusR
VKPFAFSELLARVRSILRRGAARQSTVLKVADLEIDLVRHRATRCGRLLDLTPKEFLLLSLLLRRSGDVLSRTLIAEQVWVNRQIFEVNMITIEYHRSPPPSSGTVSFSPADRGCIRGEGGG